MAEIDLPGFALVPCVKVTAAVDRKTHVTEITNYPRCAERVCVYKSAGGMCLKTILLALGHGMLLGLASVV